MGLVSCQDCGKQISDVAPTCPHCGRPRPPEVQAQDRQEKEKADRMVGYGCGGCLTIVIVLVVIGMTTKRCDQGAAVRPAPSPHPVVAPAGSKEEWLRSALASRFGATVSVKLLNIHPYYGADGKLAGDLVGLTYVDSVPARDDLAVKENVVGRMAAVVEMVFALPDANRIMLKANYPAIEGDELAVASLDITRAEFSPGRGADTYPGFGLVGRLKRLGNK